MPSVENMGIGQYGFVVPRRLLLAVVALVFFPAPGFAGQPNIVLIISDDAGWADFGFNDQGNGEIPTPAIDSIAGRGVWFRSAYTAPVCSMSRARMFLGMHPQRTGYESNMVESEDASDAVVEGLRLGDTTLFERMRDAGYHVGYFGKWHLGTERDVVSGGELVTPGNLPPRHGIDEFLGLTLGSRQYFTGWNSEYSKRLREMTLDAGTDLVVDVDREGAYPVGSYVTDVLAAEAAGYISERSAEPGPFFAVLSFTAPHLPLQTTPGYLAMIDKASPWLTGDRRTYGAMMIAMDAGVRTVLDRLADPNGDGDTSDSIVEDTLVCFINDNGGQMLAGAVNEPLRGGKGEPYEGGIRVPMCMAGPGVPSTGASFDDPVDSVDLMPTLLAAAGAPLGPGDMTDGVDLLPYLNGAIAGEPHEHLYVRGVLPKKYAVRRGDWKAITHVFGGPLLFDLGVDLGETTDVGETHPSIVDGLVDVMYAYESEYAKARWGHEEEINAFDSFEYLVEAGSVSSWSGDGVWAASSGDPAAATMHERDGYANLVTRFPTNDGPYTAKNDLSWAHGFPFMLNRIECFGAHAGPVDSSALIQGKPLLFVDSLGGEGASIRMDAVSGGAGAHPFFVTMDLVLWDDLALGGGGTERLVLSGTVGEERTGRSVTKTGGWPLEVRGGVEVSGAVRLVEGSVLVSGGGRLDASLVRVEPGVALVLSHETSPFGGPDLVGDETELSIGSAVGGASVTLDFEGIEVVGSMTLDGAGFPPGVYGAGTHPGVFAGEGSVRVLGALGCNAADLSEPFGLLDLADLQGFVQAFIVGDWRADLAEPWSVVDLNDLVAFIEAFGAGCP